jgi:hypothetical protein
MRDTLPPFVEFGFPGHPVTGREFVDAISQTVGGPMRVTTLSWFLLRMFGPLIPIFGELSELAYLWQQPHRIDGRQLRATIGQVPHTPLAAAVAAALRDVEALR